MNLQIKQGETIEQLSTDCNISCRNIYTGEEFLLCVMQSANLPTIFLKTDSGTTEPIKADKEYEDALRRINSRTEDRFDRMFSDALYNKFLPSYYKIIFDLII